MAATKLCLGMNTVPDFWLYCHISLNYSKCQRSQEAPFRIYIVLIASFWPNDCITSTYQSNRPQVRPNLFGFVFAHKGNLHIFDLTART